MATLHAKKSWTIAVITSLTTYSTATYLIEALALEGHSVFVISDTSHPLVSIRANGAFDLADLLRQEGISPDLILFIEGGSMQLFPVGFEGISSLTAWYGIDTHMNYEKHLRISRVFDVTFVAQKEFVEKLLADGIRQISWLPLASAPSIYPKQSLERKYDISYVGSNDALMHPERHQMLSSIQKQFSNVWIGKASPIDMGRIYSESKIVFNRSINNDVNMRIFEAMGAGCVLLTNEIVNNGFEDLFPEHQPYITYKNEANLLEIIDELLSDPMRIKKIGGTAKVLIEKRHTYQLRTQVLVSSLKAFSKLKTPSKLDLFSALMIMSMMAPAFHCLASYLRGRHSVGVIRVVNYLCALMLNILELILVFIYRCKHWIGKLS